jgi:hypothetical protein
MATNFKIQHSADWLTTSDLLMYMGNYFAYSKEFREREITVS